MYIIIEGMPGTGKTTLAKELCKKTNGIYMKSIVSQNDFGNSIRSLHSSRAHQKEMEYLYLIDLALDELKISNLLENNNIVIRDKCYASSLAHIITHGFANKNDLLKKCILEGFKELSNSIIEPELVIFLKADFNKVRNHFYNKTELSDWDLKLIRDVNKYIKQEQELESEVQKRFGSAVIKLDSFSKTPEEMSKEIIKKVNL